ncbi:hypothetical protein KDW23_09235 [Burkholderia cenocepacia]|uniref:hypothetical protein n=1 Tax=Burkholderia cenocepacia TaxID=95486 RepID=UPI001BA36CFB|nr:hypothetical protein [Burkholderia cenocepacia]MBR8070651.1 hypothetical protein [Burkholderia cenocepacia]MBR8444880.1 hypothetical protein [Burkholderia cenocepacia]
MADVDGNLNISSPAHVHLEIKSKSEGMRRRSRGEQLDGDGWRSAATIAAGVPGYKGEAGQKGDGVIADPVTELDPSAKAGPIITPNPGAKVIEALITSTVPDSIKQLVQAVVNAVGEKSTGDSFEKSLVNLPPGERVA